jgi:hypothetical protein
MAESSVLDDVTKQTAEILTLSYGAGKCGTG